MALDGAMARKAGLATPSKVLLLGGSDPERVPLKRLRSGKALLSVRAGQVLLGWLDEPAVPKRSVLLKWAGAASGLYTGSRVLLDDLAVPRGFVLPE